MSASHKTRAGTRGGKDQFNWDTVKSDKDRECYLGHSLMAPTGRWQEGKDITWYAKDRDNEQQIKSAEFRAAKKLEEDALMAALGMKPLPTPPTAAASSQYQKPVIKREPQSTSVKNEPMTPAIHGDSSRHGKHREHQKKHDNQRREDRRRRRQLKATGSDEEKHEWSASDIDDDDDDDEDNDDDDKTKESDQQDLMTDKDLDEFLIDLVKKHGMKIIQRALKSKKDKKERKRKHESKSSSSASESEDEKRETKHKHKKKHSHKEESNSTKRRRTRSPSPSRKDRSKHHSNRH
ncbi:hypothetical protein I4U23_021286 [Adineta vaga]|nr:hypothetical protein I4U23_021286 [Adineta vaga]